LPHFFFYKLTTGYKVRQSVITMTFSRYLRDMLARVTILICSMGLVATLVPYVRVGLVLTSSWCGLQQLLDIVVSRLTSGHSLIIPLCCIGGPIQQRVEVSVNARKSLLADRTKTVMLSPYQFCVRLSSSVCTECTVAKRCALEQKLLLTAYRKSYMKNRLVPKLMTLTFVKRSFKVMSTIASHSPWNISETVRDRGLVPKDHQ